MKYEVYNLYPMLQASFSTEEEAFTYIRDQASHYGMPVFQPNKHTRALLEALTTNGIYTLKEVTNPND